MQLPIEVAKLSTEIASRKKLFVKPPRAFNYAFRVSEQEYENFFTVPKVDGKADLILKQLNTSNKLTLYSRFWESELFVMDTFMRSMTRLAAFQLSVLNASLVELQPLQDQDNSNSEFAIPATELATDIAAQMMKLSINHSHRITRLRRQNVCVGIKTKVIDMLADDLMVVSYDADPTHLFGGLYDKTSKLAAKKQEAANATKRSQGGFSRSSTSNYTGARKNQQYHNQGSSASSSSSSRGYKRKNDGNYTHPAKRGRGTGQGRGRRGGRGPRRGGGQGRQSRI
jgi:hypothetical protein